MFPPSCRFKHTFIEPNVAICFFQTNDSARLQLQIMIRTNWNPTTYVSEDHSGIKTLVEIHCVVLEMQHVYSQTVCPGHWHSCSGHASYVYSQTVCPRHWYSCSGQASHVYSQTVCPGHRHSCSGQASHVYSQTVCPGHWHSCSGQQTSQTNPYPDSLNEINLFLIATSNLPIVPSLQAVNQRTDREQSCRSLRLFKLSRRPEGLKTKRYWELPRAPRVTLQQKSSSEHFSPLIV